MDTTQLRIMIIDDQGTMRSIIRRILQQAGFQQIVEAESGKAALELLLQRKDGPPDIIISDLHMEAVDGLEFCNRCRLSKDRALRSIPILMLTGDQDDFIHDVARQAGACTVLTKPFTASDLLGEIGKAIGFSIAAA